MSYEPPEYGAIKRNVIRSETMLRHVDNARTFNKLKLAENLTLSGKGRFDDRPTTITIAGDLMEAVLEMAAARSIEAAKAIHSGEWEANDFERAAAV